MPREHGRLRKSKQGKAYSLFSNVAADIRALNSSIMIISQKMKYLVRNEKILGRNLLVLNKKIKAIESGTSIGSGEGAGIGLSQLEEINAKLEELTKLTTELKADIDDIKNTYAKDELVKEIKYVIDSINPLEFTTFKDVEKIVEEKIGSKKR